MGKLRFYQPFFSLIAGLITTDAYSGSAVTVPTYKDTSGTEHTTLYLGASPSYNDELKSMVHFFQGMTAYATADLSDNYSISDYSAQNIENSSVNIQQIFRLTAYSTGQVVTITNNSEEQKNVNCIKFVKNLYYNYSTTRKSPCLICGYYLDTPLTLAAGESKTITIEMKVGTDVSAS